MSKDEETEKIIGCAIRVHKKLGPGLLEAVYESAMKIELDRAGIVSEAQKELPVLYDGVEIGRYRMDLVINNRVVVELKSVERMDALFNAQLLSYMKLGGYRKGLLINFNSRLLKDGIKRMVL